MAGKGGGRNGPQANDGERAELEGMQGHAAKIPDVIFHGLPGEKQSFLLRVSPSELLDRKPPCIPAHQVPAAPPPPESQAQEG